MWIDMIFSLISFCNPQIMHNIFSSCDDAA